MTFSYPSRLELILLMASGTLTYIISEAYDASTAEGVHRADAPSPYSPKPLGTWARDFHEVSTHISQRQFKPETAPPLIWPVWAPNTIRELYADPFP